MVMYFKSDQQNIFHFKVISEVHLITFYVDPEKNHSEFQQSDN